MSAPKIVFENGIKTPESKAAPKIVFENGIKTPESTAASKNSQTASPATLPTPTALPSLSDIAAANLRTAALTNMQNKPAAVLPSASEQSDTTPVITPPTVTTFSGGRTTGGGGRTGTANQRELSQIKSELEAAKSAEKSAMGKLDAYMLTYSGALDLRDPAELQTLRDNAIAATKAREQLEQEYNAHEGSFEDQYGELSSAERAAVGIIGSPFAAVDVIAQTVKSAINGDNTMDMDTLAMQNYKKAQQLKASATENLSGPGKFLADTGISIAQNLYALPMNVVMPGGSLAVMGTTAAADKMAELGDQGESATRSLVRGAISGGIEAATEKIPLDSLADLVKTGGKGVIKNLLKQGGVEATEEGVAYAANYIADKLAKDPNATWDWADFANSVASGGVSGLFFGLGGTAVNRVSNSSINSNGVFLPGSGLDTPVEARQTAQSDATPPTKTVTAPNVTAATQDTTAQNTTFEDEDDALPRLAQEIRAKLDSEAAVEGQKNTAPNVEAVVNAAGVTPAESEATAVSQLRSAGSGTTVSPTDNVASVNEKVNSIISGVLSESKGTASPSDIMKRIMSEMPDNAAKEAAVDSFSALFDSGEYGVNAAGQVRKTDAENHIDNRTFSSVGNRKIPSFQFDNPQLHEYFADAARMMQSDLSMSTKGERFPVSSDMREWSGTKRSTTDEVVALKDDAKLSYAEIDKALEAIIQDQGQENYAAAKKVEIMLDSMLTNGYTDVTGQFVPPNENYIQEKSKIAGSNPNPVVSEHGSALDMLPEMQDIHIEPEMFGSVYDIGRNTVDAAQNQTAAPKDRFAGIGPESSVGAATAGFDPYSNMLNEYGAIPEGENPARIIDVPKSTNGTDKVSMTARTVMEAQATPDSALGDIADAIVNGKFSYIPITNKATAAQAETEIKRKGFATAFADWTAEVRQGKSSAALTAMGATLYNNAINSGDTKTAMSILADYAASLRSGAQAVQAARILKTLSPDNKLYVIEGTVEALNRRFFGDSDQARGKGSQQRNGTVSQAESEISEAVQDQLDTAYSLIKNIYKAFQDEGKHGVPVEDWMVEVGKLLSEDIARKVSRNTRSTSEPITKTIQKDLLRFAKSYLPGNSQQSRQSKRTAADTIRDFFNNRENYAKAWNAAKNAYRAQNGNNQQLMDAAEEWLNGTISYSGDGSDAVILQAIVDTAIDADMTLKDIVTRADLGDLQGAEQELFRRLNAEVGATGADSQALELAVQRHLTEAVQDAGPNSDERIDKNIKAMLKDAGLKMSEIIQQNRASKEAAGQKIADMLIQEYGVSQGAAETAAGIVTERFDSMVKEAAHKKLESIFKERKKSIPKTDRQRLEQFANLGAFESEYNAQAAEKATGYRIAIDQALADEFVNAETDEARDAALDKIIQNIADQVPSSLAEKFNAFRYVNMLGNLKTQVRNVVGNTTMAVMRTAKDRIAAGIEAAVYKASGGKFERTKAFAYDPALYKAAWGDYKNVQKLALGEQKYAVTSGGSGEIMNEINDRRTIFKNNGTWGTKPEELPITRLVRKATDAAWKLPEAYREITNWAMEQGDVIFSRVNYADTLGQYLAAHKVTAEQMNTGTVDPELLDNARAYAIREAQRATFRDSNALSQAISEIGFKNADSVPKKLLNTVVQGTLPFRKTPANVLARMEEYSPLGLANTLINGVQLARGSENVTGADVVDSLAKTLTGSMLWALGLALYHAGRLVVGQDDDDEQAALDALTGGQTYAYVDADGNSYTLDWLSPAASPMFMAAEFAQLGEQNGISFWDLWEAAKTITTPMLEMSMLQGLNDALEDVSYSEDPLIDLALGGVLDYMTQGLTTTLMSQAERTSENVRMTTFTDKTSDTPTDVQYNIGSNSAKVPGWDYQQIPYIDAWGRQQEYASLPVRALENFVLPFYVSSKNETEADKEIQRLLDAGQTGVVPSRVSQSDQVTYKESPDDEESQKRYLTADEYVKYATIKGQTSLDVVSAMLDSELYQSMTDEQKADSIKRAYSYAMHFASEEITDGKHESEKYAELAQTADKELGLTIAEYLLLYEKYGGTAVNGDKVREAYQQGVDPVDYLEYNAGKKSYDADGSGGFTIVENAEAIQNSGLSESEQEIMWMLAYPEWAEKAEEKGVSNSEYIQYKVATYGCTKNADKRAALVAAGFSWAEARAMINKIG